MGTVARSGASEESFGARSSAQYFNSWWCGGVFVKKPLLIKVNHFLLHRLQARSNLIFFDGKILCSFPNSKALLNVIVAFRLFSSVATYAFCHFLINVVIFHSNSTFLVMIHEDQLKSTMALFFCRKKEFFWPSVKSSRFFRKTAKL